MPTPTRSLSTAACAEFLPFSEPWIGADEIRELLAALDSGWLTTGPRTERFEQAFRQYVGTREAVATNSCTAALHLTLQALDIGPGDAVLTSPFTFAATANVIVHSGAEVVFADITPGSYNLDPAAVEQVCAERCEPERGGGLRVTRSGHRLRAIVAVHYAGQSCAMDELGALAERYRLVLIEDAAHAAGARYGDRPVGALGHAACFSFYPTKNITTGEGGMLTTNDHTLAERARRLSQHGISRDGWQRYSQDGAWRYDVAEAGFKYNMADLQAALGLHQLKRLDGFVERRRRLAALYDHMLVGRAELVMQREQPGCFHSRHLYPVEIAAPGVSRDQFMDRLRERRIGASVHFLPLHLTSFYQRTCGFRRGDFPVAERVFERIVSLPIYPAMSEEQVERVAAACVEILEEPNRR